MKRIALLSDTHSYMDQQILDNCTSCDEIWHAGDIGEQDVIDQLESIKPVKVVYGNIETRAMREQYPLNLFFEESGLKIFMTHIGGYPGRYNKRVYHLIKKEQPDLYICGHSHILKIIPDRENDLIHMNPGACGHHGFHRMRTMIRFTIDEGKIKDVEVIELGRRGAISQALAKDLP